MCFQLSINEKQGEEVTGDLNFKTHNSINKTKIRSYILIEDVT